MYEIEVTAPYIGSKEVQNAYRLLDIAPDNLWLTIPHISRMEQAWNYMYWETVAAAEEGYYVDKITDISLRQDGKRWYGTAVMKSIDE